MVETMEQYMSKTRADYGLGKKLTRRSLYSLGRECDLELPKTNTTTKLPLLKQGEYDMWKLRIEQYFQVQDYALWDVIENGNSFKPAAQTTTNVDGSSTTLIPGPVTADEKTQKKNDVKARSMLLMALPNEHLLTFNQYKDAKTLFAAIQTRFGGNDATKKTQKTLLKQMYENFSAPSTESLDSIFNRLQKIVKGTASSSSSSSSQNLAFMSSTSSTNEVNTAYGVSTTNTQVSTASTQVSTANLSDDTVYAFLASQPNGSQLVHKDLEQIHKVDLEEMDLKWQLALLSMRTRKFFQKTGRKITINGSDTTRYDKSKKFLPKPCWLLMELVLTGALWQMKKSLQTWLIWLFNSKLEKLKQEKESNQLKFENFDNASKSLNKLIGSQIPDKGIKGLGFVSYNIVPPPPTGLFSPPNLDLSNSGLEEFQQLEFEGYGPKTSKSVSEDTSNEVTESPDASLVKELVSNDKLTAITIKGKGWPKVVNTARPNSAVVNAVRANQVNVVKASAWSDMKRRSRLCDGPKWLFDIDVLTKSMNYVPVVVDGLLFDSSSKDASSDEPQPSNDAEKKDDEGGIDDQERTKNSAQDVNTAGPSINIARTNFNTGSLNINIVSPTVPTALLESTCADFFGDESELDLSNIATTYPVPSTPTTRIHKDHSLDHVIGDMQSGEEPKKVIQALKDPSWIEAMQEKLLQFKLQQVWILVDLPYGKRGYTQEEGIDYDEVFAPVPRIEAIKLFLAYASFKDFVVYQMDVKSAFLYGKIDEEVYVCQPLGFEDPKFPNKVYKVEKALYGLHQAPRAWYETLFTYLLNNGFQRGQIDKTLFIKRIKSDILLVQKFQMSSMGELTFFLGLQVTQKDDGIFISQDKYVDEILKKFGFSTVKTASTPMETSKPLLKDAEAEDVDVHLYRSMIGSLMYLTSSRPDIMFVVCACARFQVTPKVSHLHAVKRIFRYLKGQPKLGLWYPKDSPFDLEAYSDSDYAGASLDRKSTTGGCQFLGSRLISWQCKKQTIVANSTTEAEYVAAASCCGQNGTAANDEIQVSDVGLTFYCAKTTAWNGFSSTMASAIICLATHQKFNFSKYIFDNMVKNLEGGVKFLMYPRKDIKVPQPSGSTKPITDEAANEEHVPIHSNDPLLSGEDRLKLNELMELCTNLSQRVLNLENIKTSQAAEITKLKEMVKKLERRNKSRTLGLKRLRKVGRQNRTSSEDEVFDEEEVEVEKVICTAKVTTVSATTTTVDELTLAQTLIEIKAANPSVTTAATTTTTAVTRPK
ncbi:putative ribonuclease H-like domain-containing protein [Tanacetum coccineum]